VPPSPTQQTLAQPDALNRLTTTSGADHLVVEFSQALAALANRQHELLDSICHINAHLKQVASACAATPPDGQSLETVSESVALQLPSPTEYPSAPAPLTVARQPDTLRSPQHTLSLPTKRDYNYFDKLDMILASLRQ
jgi:hypothetical protein